MPNQPNPDEVKAARDRIDATARAIYAACYPQWSTRLMAIDAFIAAEELERARAESIKRVEGKP